MTFNQIASHVTSEIGQVDPNSLQICMKFIERRYEGIYDSEFWLDAQDDASTVTVGSQNYIEYPPTLERIQSIRLNGKMLEPITRQRLIEIDPTIFDREGEPLYWLDYFEKTTRTNRVRFFPSPDQAYPVLIIGRTAFPGITAQDDKPVLRNIDNALIAFTLGDMLRRQRVWAKADKAYEEAATQLDLMRKMEMEQSNRLRASKALSVTGDSLSELVDAVCARCGAYGADNLILAREFVRRFYQTVYDSNLWQESQVWANVSREDAEVVLPEYFDLIIGIRANTGLGALANSDGALYFGLSPQIFEQTGSPVSFQILTPVAVAVLPETNEPLALVSSSAMDRSPVFIRGETAGVEVSETVTLSGISPVVTQYTYDTPLTIAKDVTQGDVTISGSVSTTFFQKIPATERERKHIRLWLQPTPTANDDTVCLCLGKRKIKPLLTDQDTPLLRGIGNVLIAGAAANMFERIGNKASADGARSEAQGQLQILLDKQKQQGAAQPRIIPYVDQAWGGGYFGDNWYGDFMDKGLFLGGTTQQTTTNAEQGTINLSSGQLSVSVSFVKTKSGSYAFDYLYVQNLVDASPLFIGCVPTAITGNGFGVSLTAAPDSNNYTLKWKVS